MPKVYHRKSNRAKWNPYAMLAAMADVREKKLTLHQSSVIHGVPRSTMNYRLKTENGEFKAAYVRETVIGHQNEVLVERIICLQRVGFGLTANDIRRMAFEFAVKNNTAKANLFNAEKKIAGWDWYAGFMERHPSITLRKSQAISFARAQCMNRPQVDAFFDMLGVELDRLGLRQSPQAIYNMDESGLHLHFRPGKVLAAKGDRSILQVMQSERAENVTVVGCCSASGHFIPPLVIYKEKRNKAEFADNLPPGSSVAMSDSGYITTDIFLTWLHHFNQHKAPGKVLLLLDGHAPHVKSISVIDLAQSYDITLVCLPPHTTHYL
jgi:DDE superfamily endonuclease/helix-turn-helix, Psq domain